LNIVPGLGPVAGASLVRHLQVDLLSFTGSIAVGKEVMRVASERLARVSLELGGKSPNLVFPDADLDLAVKGAARAIFRSQGQSCVAGSRLLLHESIYDLFLERLIKAAEEMRVGDPTDPSTQIGPLITREHRHKVEGYIRSGMEEGARLLAGGSPPQDPLLEKGNYLRPTIFDQVKSGMRIAEVVKQGDLPRAVEIQRRLNRCFPRGGEETVGHFGTTKLTASVVTGIEMGPPGRPT
jgi:acyl-CoA reductase-like NAD-dependent aldehyde dehydrogenase